MKNIDGGRDGSSPNRGILFSFLFRNREYKIFVFFLSCSSESKDLVFTTPEIILQADGPRLEGANTAQGHVKSTLAEFLKTTGTSLDKVSEATLIGVTLILPDSMNSSLLSEITLQLAADNVDMQKVGVLNPVPEGQTRLTLNIAKEQEKIGKILQLFN